MTSLTLRDHVLSHLHDPRVDGRPVRLCSPGATLAPVRTGSVVAPAVQTPAAAATWSPPARRKMSGCISQGWLPDPASVPDAPVLHADQGDLAANVCRRGYAATVRPPLSVTEPIKGERVAANGLYCQPLSGFEWDHRIPLEFGGAPADVANLLTERDAVENLLNCEVCRETIHLVEAQRQIATDWLGVYRSRGLQPAP